MKSVWRHSVPSWRAMDSRGSSVAKYWWVPLVAFILILEVWQHTTVASLSVEVERATEARKRANNELEWMRTELDRSATRAEVGSLAAEAGVRPGDSRQIVWLPADYLEEDGGAAKRNGSPALLAQAGQALLSLVPDASARGRHLN